MKRFKAIYTDGNYFSEFTREQIIHAETLEDAKKQAEQNEPSKLYLKIVIEL